MLVPTYHIEHLVNMAHSRSFLNDPDHFKGFNTFDYVAFDQYSNCDSKSTWSRYDFASCTTETPSTPSDIIGTMSFPFTRPTKIIEHVSIAMFDPKHRLSYYRDLMKVLEMIHRGKHPVIYFTAVEGTDSHGVYSNMETHGFLTEYDKPYSFTIINGDPVPFHHFSMSHEQLGKFINRKNGGAMI